MGSKYFVVAYCVSALFLTGCENTDLQKVADAGKDAVSALTLSDKDVQAIAAQSAQASDNKQTLP
jgi:PBP1b-binding outer membrane lipoprotein LpoB